MDSFRPEDSATGNCVFGSTARVHGLLFISDNRLAFVVAIPLVLIDKQGLVALGLAGPGTDGARGGCKNGSDHHEGRNYCHGDDFGEGESLTWKGRSPSLIIVSSSFTKLASLLTETHLQVAETNIVGFLGR